MANGPQRTRAPLLANGAPDVAAAPFSAHLTHSRCLQVKCSILTASLQVTYSKSPLSTGKVQHDSGVKDSPPYLHDGRLLTLEDTVEFFNLVLELQLAQSEKTDLVAFLRVL